MKNVKRNFVVEYKSSRRQAKPQAATSIWGNLDLKSIASAVDEDVTLPNHTASDEGTSASPVVTLPAPDLAISEISSEITSPMADVPRDDQAETTVSQADKVTASPAARSPATKRVYRKLRAAPSTVVETKANNQQRDQSSAEVSSGDDLEVLQRENVELKARWREKLKLENAELTRLLARFQ